MTPSVGEGLAGSRDPLTGEVFVPPRRLSTDGGLRELESTMVPPWGVLAEVVAMGNRYYGYLDLDDDVRLIGEVIDDEPAVGAVYRVVEGGDGRGFERA